MNSIEKMFKKNFQMAPALLGRGSLHTPRVPLEAENQALSGGIGGICKLPRPERARAIWKSIYYAKMVKFEILGLDHQFSKNQILPKIVCNAKTIGLFVVTKTKIFIWDPLNQIRSISYVLMRAHCVVENRLNS